MKVRKDFLPIAVPDLGSEERRLVTECLDSGWISVGPKVKEFEKMFAEYHGVKNAVAVSSCTTALLVAARALGIGSGDMVIVPTITWQSTANIVEQLEATPLFCDVDMHSMNILPSEIERHFDMHGSRIKAVIPVHHSGLPCDIEAVSSIAAKHGVPVIYDAAHAVFSLYDGKMIGGYGAMSCFSFYATKNITTGDGGMITTDDDELAEICRLWSYHGLPKDSWKRYSSENSSPHVQCVLPGYKFNLTDMQAALGIAQMSRKEELLEKRNLLVMHYESALAAFDWIERPIHTTERGKWGNHVYSVKILDEDVDRDLFMSELRKLNIGTNLHFYPVHKNIYYESKYPYVKLPNAEWLMNRIVTIPLCTKYSTDDLDYVAEAIGHVYSNRLAHKKLQPN